MNKKMIQEKGTRLRARKNSHGSRLFYLFVGLIIALPTQAQMLFSENMTMAIDSTKTIQGSLQPVVDFKTEK